jgi:hypothetical protein
VSGEPTVSRANGRPQNPRATRGKCQRSDVAPDCPVCTGQCPVCQAGVCQLAALGKQLTAYDYKSPDCLVVHRTVRWCTGVSGEPTVSRANGRPQNPRATRGKCQRSDGAPDCPVCIGQCPVRQRLQDCNGRLRQIRKEIRTGQCPVVHRTVRCARRQKARIAFLECSQRLLAALGL